MFHKMNKILFLVFVLGLSPVFVFGNDSEKRISELENQTKNLQNLTQSLLIQRTQDSIRLESSNEKITDLTTKFQRMEIIGISTSGLTILGILWFIFYKFPKTAKELMQKKIETDGSLLSDKNNFKEIRLAVIGRMGKNSAFDTYLISLGFNREKLKYAALTDYQTIDSNNTDYILFQDEDNQLTEFDMNNIIGHFGNGTRYFYLGTKRLSADLYQSVKPGANSRDTFEGNFLKALRQ